MNIVKLSLLSGVTLVTGSLMTMEPNQSISLVYAQTCIILTPKELACQNMLAQINEARPGTMAQHFQEIKQFRALDPARQQIPIRYPELERMNPMTLARIADVEKRQIAERKAQETLRPELPILEVKPPTIVQKIQSERTGDTSKDGQFFRFPYKEDARRLKINAIRSIETKRAEKTPSPLDVQRPQQQQTYTPEEKNIVISRTTSSEIAAQELTQLVHKAQTTSLTAASESGESAEFPSAMEASSAQSAIKMTIRRPLTAKQKRRKEKRDEAKRRREQDFFELSARVAEAQKAKDAPEMQE